MKTKKRWRLRRWDELTLTMQMIIAVPALAAFVGWCFWGMWFLAKVVTR